MKTLSFAVTYPKRNKTKTFTMLVRTAELYILRPSVSEIVHDIGRLGMNQKEIIVITIPIPRLDEQQRIRVEGRPRLFVVREVESAVEAGLVRVGKLMQAASQSALEGRLCMGNKIDYTLF